MASLGSLESLQALSALLSTQQDDDDDDKDRKNVATCAQLGPGHIGPPPKPSAKKDGSTAYVMKSSKDIWSEEEVAEGAQYDDLADPRPQPEYEIILKQNVGTEDLFLGLSRKDPSSMCCEAMLVKIKLPGTKATDVILDVKEKFLDLRTPKYKLGLHLPHPVHSQEGRAQFYSEREELEVTLLMNRLMDSINMQ
ncbi:dynein axonemal assembly factor 6 [Myripristis murdjan]|uniref:Dynein axonemal assembly factor 6 n=1 Tax=Myripristis murdjan TaxID=586833 RepID=A0A667Z9Y9_9TELE|nr:protein PIH1D3 [Myripristis murdjan]